MEEKLEEDRIIDGLIDYKLEHDGEDEFAGRDRDNYVCFTYDEYRDYLKDLMKNTWEVPDWVIDYFDYDGFIFHSSIKGEADKDPFYVVVVEEENKLTPLDEYFTCFPSRYYDWFDKTKAFLKDNHSKLRIIEYVA